MTLQMSLLFLTLSVLQGVPVATVAIDNAANAGCETLLQARIPQNFSNNGFVIE
jgi:phosphoribosylcarboxyaminoimidazole (NCAIR) mutase